VLDYPHTDPSAWEAATEAAIAVHKRSTRPVAVVASLPELLPLEVSARLLANGVVPIHGLSEALAAAAAVGRMRPATAEPALPALRAAKGQMVTEADAKTLLAEFGVQSPLSVRAECGDDLTLKAADLTPPLVLKAEGVAHKSETGGICLNLDAVDLPRAAEAIPTKRFLIEEMVTGTVAELLIGVTRDPAHGFVLTLAAGGVMTELLQDRTSLLLPVLREQVRAALSELKVYRLLCGFRGADAADIDAILDAVMRLQNCVMAQPSRICEIEINPLICTATRAVAADALIVVAADPD
jgi:acetyl-CoA synthetase